MKLLVSLLFVGVSLGAFAQDILKMKHLHEIASHIQEGDWVIFDVDYTLLEGSKPVVGALSVVHDLHQKDIPVFCLTATSFKQSYIYDDRLSQAGFNIHRTASQFGIPMISPERFGREECGFYEGCIFAPRDPKVEDSIKGPALEQFLDLIAGIVPKKPKRILFVDDQERNLVSVKGVLPDIPKVLFHFDEVEPAPKVVDWGYNAFLPRRPRYSQSFWDDILYDRPLHWREVKHLWR